MEVYFHKVLNAKANKIITENEYQKLLTQPTSIGHKPLHHAADSGSFEIVKLFVMVLESYFTLAELITIFNARARGYLPISQQGKKDATAINNLLNSHRDEYANLEKDFLSPIVAPSLKRDRTADRSKLDTAEPDYKRPRSDERSTSASTYRGARTFERQFVSSSQPQPKPTREDYRR